MSIFNNCFAQSDNKKEWSYLDLHNTYFSPFLFTQTHTLQFAEFAVYDVTIAYKNQCPTFLDNAFGVDPSEVHIHVRRIPLEKIPESEKKASELLIETFQFKDQLLSDFIATGHFPK